MNLVVEVLKNKIRCFFNSRLAWSSILVDVNINNKASVRHGVRLYHVKLDKYSYVGRNSLVQNTEIGSFCSISEGCYIGMPSHPIDFISTSPVFLSGSNYLKMNFSEISYDNCPITFIGNDVWVGVGVKIKSGVRIGDGAILAAGTIVTKNVPPYAIVGGIPAKIIRYRFKEDEIDAIKKSKWWDWDEGTIKKNGHLFNDVNQFIGEIQQ